MTPYTPQHLAERILTSRAALQGERKHVTVLFADTKGSTELIADRDPEEAQIARRLPELRFHLAAFGSRSSGDAEAASEMDVPDLRRPAAILQGAPSILW